MGPDTPEPTAVEGAGVADDPPRLGVRDLLLYALPGTGTTFLFTLLLVVYMNYATEVLGASAALIGAIFFGARVWDGVSDPLVGYWSDRTRSRWGRRKTWLLASALPLAVFAVAVWRPPAALAGPLLGVWIAVAILGFYTAFTLFEVPHMALGAELTQHRRDRIRVFGGRQLGKTLGLFAAFGLGASLVEDLSTARVRLGALVLGASAFAAASIVLAVVALPRERPDYAARGPVGSLRAARDVWGNPNARVLLFVYLVEQLGLGGIGVLVPFVVRYVMQTPDLIAEMLLAYTVPAVLSIPMWMWLGERYDKRDLWMRAMGMSCVGFGLLLFVDQGTVRLMLVASLVAGTASGCGPTLGQALKADVIDFDEYRTGERKEGAYFAAWNLVSKLASGVMLGVVGLALEASGFRAGAPEQSGVARATMVLLMGGMPVLGFGVGMLVFRRFRLTQEEHDRVLAALEARALSSRSPPGGAGPG